jgi:hypothetical protein
MKILLTAMLLLPAIVFASTVDGTAKLNGYQR